MKILRALAAMTELSKDTGTEELVGSGVENPIIRDEFEFAALSHSSSENKQNKIGLCGPIFQVTTPDKDQFRSFLAGWRE